jgi:hypothetical protein
MSKVEKITINHLLEWVEKMNVFQIPEAKQM